MKELVFKIDATGEKAKYFIDENCDYHDLLATAGCILLCASDRYGMPMEDVIRDFNKGIAESEKVRY